MADINSLLAKARPQERTVRVVVDGALASAYAAADHAHKLALSAQASAPQGAPSLGGDPVVSEFSAAVDSASAALDAARAALEAGMDSFVMRYPGHEKWADLQAANPPRPDHPEDGAWNDATFAPAAIAVCCVDPVMTADEASQLLSVLSMTDRSSLFGCALEVSVGAVSVPR